MEAVIHITGEIGEDVRFMDVLTAVQEAKGATAYRFVIDSIGGYVDEGFRIARLIEGLDKPTTTVAKVVYSIANVIFFASDTREAEEGAEFMLHNAWFQPPPGNASDLKAWAEMLEREDSKIRGYIAERTGISDSALMEVMSTDTYINEAQAKALGFFTVANRLRLVAKAVRSEESYTDYPESASNNAKRALAWLEENGNPNGCLTAVGFARANQLAKREPLSRDTIARMAAFRRHQQNKDVPYADGCGGIAWDAWGGESGVAWAERKLEQIDSKTNNSEMAEQENAKGLLEQIKGLLGIGGQAKNMDLELADGQAVYVESEDGELEGKPTNAPDGTHSLKDGRSITVEGGRVVSVQEASAMEEEPAEEEEPVAMDEEKEKMRAENEALRQQLADMTEKAQASEAQAKAQEEMHSTLVGELVQIKKYITSNAQAQQKLPKFMQEAKAQQAELAKSEAEKRKEEIAAKAREMYGERMAKLMGTEKEWRDSIAQNKRVPTV